MSNCIEPSSQIRELCRAVHKTRLAPCCVRSLSPCRSNLQRWTSLPVYYQLVYFTVATTALCLLIRLSLLANGRSVPFRSVSFLRTAVPSPPFFPIPAFSPPIFPPVAGRTSVHNVCPCFLHDPNASLLCSTILRLHSDRVSQCLPTILAANSSIRAFEDIEAISLLFLLTILIDRINKNIN